MQFAGSFTPLLGTAVSSVVDAVLGAGAILASLAAFALIFSAIFTVLYLVFEYTPQGVVDAVLYWNRFFGPALHTLVFTPAMLLSNVLRPLLAIWNFVIWVSYRIGRQVLLVGGLEQIVAVQGAASATGSLIKHLSISLADFSYALLVDCDYDERFTGDLCYEAESRELDLVTPMRDVGAIVRNLSVAVGGVCSVAAAPLDMAVYPFTDLSVARGVHKLVNAVLFTLFHLPVVTLKRCSAHRSLGVAMCLPDFDPVVDMLTVGLRQLGQGLDNWINVIGAVSRKSVGGAVATCDALSDGLTASRYSRVLFGDRQVAVVGLTDHLYAVTDGIGAQYFSHSSRFESVLAPSAFPLEIDPRHGVASVVYSEFVDERDEVGNQRTSMMGCRCVDDEESGEMRIECAFAMYGDDAEQVPTFKAVFAKRTTALYMTCLRTQISVQSVRWSANRILSSGARELRGACQVKGTCSRVDAVVHVQPLCGAEGSPGLACTPLFTESSCYPYCMAARVSGSGTEDLILYDAAQWRDSVLVVDRDCAVDRQLGTGALVEACVQSGSCGMEAYDLPMDQVMTKLPRSFLEDWVVDRKWDVDQGCTLVGGSVSLIPQAKLLPDASSLSFSSVAGVGQPFSFAGDTTLTAVVSGSGEWSIRVDRLYGSERNEFTMTTVRRSFPAISPDPKQTFSYEGEYTDVRIPPVYSDMSGVQHPSVATRSSVFFVVNPSLSMFKGFGAWCYTSGMQGVLQLSALSSYAGIRVYKIDPFTYCPGGDDGSDACVSQEAGWAAVPGGYTDDPRSPFDSTQCQRKFSVAVTSMELLDDHNIVVTVLNATLSEFDLHTGKLKEGATRASYDLLYLNPATMAISGTPFVEQEVETLTVEGLLCPSMRVYPPVGSLATEAGVILAEFIRFPVALVAWLPGLIEHWQSGRKCTAASHGHALLKGCGEDMFTLAGFWESLTRFNQIFWSTLGYVAGGLRKLGNEGTADLVDGVAYFGENTAASSGSLPGGLAAVPRAVMIPVGDMGGSITAAVFPMMPRLLTAGLSGNPIRVAKFAFQLVGRSVSRIIPIAVSGRDVLQRLTLAFLDTLHWSRSEYHDGVVRSIHRACAGLSLMVGYGNPWGNLLRKSCEAVPLGTMGLYDLLLAVVNEVPVVKCLCVDARRTGAFWRYALDTCHPKVPTHLQPLVLDLIQTAHFSGDVDAACSAMVEHAIASVEGSMGPYFAKALDAADEVSSSIDYILTKFGSGGAGRCLDFDDNVAGAIVLIPEPYDYFSACSLTTFCATRCATELNAFKQALALTAAPPVTVAETVTVQAPFFTEANEDSFMPMNIVCMAELSATDMCPPRSRALAVAGVDANSTLVVKKFCIPTGKGLSTFQAQGESWFVWYSEDWSSTVLDMQFADASRGDALVILRDGSGGGEAMESVTGPDETFVSVHARVGQSDPDVWRRTYWSPQDRVDRQMLFKPSVGVPGKGSWSVAAVADMITQPVGGSRDVATVALYLDVQIGSEAIVRRSVCASFGVTTEAHLQALAAGSIAVGECETVRFAFEKVREGYVAALYPEGVWLIPTKKELDLHRVPFVSGGLNRLDEAVVVPSHGRFGQRAMGSSFSTWNRMSRGLLSGMKGLFSANEKVTGQSASSDYGPRICQNTVSGAGDGELQLFVTGDPGVATHWLSVATVSFSGGDVSSVGRQASFPTSVEMTVTLQCNRESCLGCPTTALLNLCYALRQCAVVNCVGTTVSLKRPLCNVGLLMQNNLVQSIQLTQSAWTVFTETYRSILRLSIGVGDKTFSMEWVDDSFFGYVCLAKNSGGNMVALFTSFLGAVVTRAQSTYTMDLSSGEQVLVDTRASARSTMIFAGTTSMLYQISLMPLYMLIVQQKMATCTASNLLTTVEESGLLGGFKIAVGRKDLSKASDAAAGMCLTSFFENELNERPTTMDKSAMATTLLDTAPGTGYETIQKGVQKIASASMTQNLMVLYHSLDALITYSSGVVSGLQDMAQSIDEQHCRLPDYYMYKNLDCACGDRPLRIKQSSRADSDSSFWCKGFLELSDAFGKSMYVYNPYTYDELVTRVEGSAKAYLTCLAALDGVRRSCPWTPVPGIDDGSTLESKVSIAVLQKCRTNYLLKEWDTGAYQAFVGAGGPLSPVEQCLVDDGAGGLGAQRCLDQYLASKGIGSDDYFAYETDAGSSSADACIVASGPAGSGNAEVAKKFAPCIAGLETCGDGGAEGTCQLSPMIWEGSTSNRVPVGHMHNVVEGDVEDMARSMVECAKAKVLGELEKYSSYSNKNNLDVMIFSAEGDALHQVLDCVFMGPFSKVKFWSDGKQEALPVPSYARDKGGLGQSRQLELPCTPGEDKLPPFTCGSTTRKRIVKSFVRQFVGDGDGAAALVESLVRDKIGDLLSAWGTPTEELLCGKDGGEGCIDFFPTKLNVSFASVSGTHVAKAVFSRIPTFVDNVFTENDAFTYASPGDDSGADLWDWEKLQLSDIARESGLFDATEPVVEYSKSEAGFPFKGGQTLWDMCTGLVGQVMFTMPLRDVDGHWTASTAAVLLANGYQFDYTTLEGLDTEGSYNTAAGSTPLEQYVSGLLLDAFKESPMFWHYAMRHTPSESLFCDMEDLPLANATLKFDLADVKQLDWEGLPDVQLPLHGYAAFPVGASNRSCLCGWGIGGGICRVPAAVCSAAGLLAEQCTYAARSRNSDFAEETVLQYWAGGGTEVDCPEHALSDAWGFIVERNQMFLGNKRVDWKGIEGDQKRAAYTIQGRQLAEFSPAGIRLGNLGDMPAKASAAINPSSRVHKLRTATGTAAIQRCGDSILDSVSVDDLLQDVVEDLFPASQGVKESRPMSVCLRFSIEYLRQQLLLVMQSNGVPNLDAKINAQTGVAERWRLKCTAQLDMMGVCNSNRVFNIIPQRKREHRCPFSVSDEDFPHYVTSGCIVFSQRHDAFFDPCRGAMCDTQGIAIQALADCFECRLPFDVRHMASNDPLGVFPTRFLGEDEERNEELRVLAELVHAERLQGRAGEIPWRMRPEFARDVVSGGSSVGNVHPGQDWWSAEGFAKDGSALFCDAIQDWWPTGWDRPVGYHVTLPCTGGAHRTLDSAFAVRVGDRGETYMVFHSMMLRNQTSFGNEFGVGGFCRRSSYGMPRFETNTMRVCTQDAEGVQYDPSVPIQPQWGGGFGDEHCSTTAFDTPWNIEDANEGRIHPSMFSTGHVPFYSQAIQENSPYPLYWSQVAYVRPGINDTDWNAECGIDDVFSCDSDDQCVALEYDPGVQERLKCYRGVCVLLDQGACYAHEHCKGRDMMCSAAGVCEAMSWEVHNDLPADDVDVDLFTENCTGVEDNRATSYDTWGASQWHDVPDVLRMYGLCSHRSWYEYLAFIGKVPPEDALDGVSARAPWMDTKRGTMDDLWRKEKFRVRAHACDRDYMHLEGMQGCTPKLDGSDRAYSGFFRVINGVVRRIDPDGDLTRSEYARTIQKDGDDYRVHMSPSTQWGPGHDLGFMSVELLGDPTYVYCRNEVQCIEDEEADTFQGMPFEGGRQVYDESVPGKMRPWTWDDEKYCGSFGIQQAGGCVLDHAILPLYRVLCVQKAAMPQCGFDAAATCANIDSQYSGLMSLSSNEARLARVRQTAIYLNQLWDGIATNKGADTSATSEYVRKMDCSAQLYEAFQGLACPESGEGPFCTSYHVVLNAGRASATGYRKELLPAKVVGGYYVSVNTFREFPFLWYQKCSIMRSRTLDDAAGKCEAWDEYIEGYDFQPGAIVPYETLLRYDAGITSEILGTAKASMEADIRSFVVDLKGATNTWEFLGWAENRTRCVAGVKYNQTGCDREIITWGLSAAKTSTLPAACAQYTYGPGQDSVSGLLKQSMITYNGLPGQVSRSNFLASTGTAWQEADGFVFDWDSYSFADVALRNVAATWTVSESTALTPRLTVEEARQRLGDASFLKCSPSELSKVNVASDAHCEAMYNFIDAQITTLSNGQQYFDSNLRGKLAFTFNDQGGAAVERMRQANRAMRDGCKRAVSDGHKTCRVPDDLKDDLGDFCATPSSAAKNFRDGFAARAYQSGNFKSIPFGLFCTVFRDSFMTQADSYGPHWFCTDTPGVVEKDGKTIFWEGAEHRQTAANAQASAFSFATSDTNLNPILSRLVGYKKRYSGDDFFIRRVFYQDTDGKRGWRFMGQAYEDTWDTSVREGEDRCWATSQPTSISHYDYSLLGGTSTMCWLRKVDSMIANDDADFTGRVADAFIQSFVNDMYRFVGEPSDVVGCYSGTIVTKKDHYTDCSSGDCKFKLKDVTGMCGWACTGCSTYSILQEGYARLKASIDSSGSAAIFRAPPPSPQKLAFHERPYGWSFTGGLNLNSLQRYEENIVALGKQYSCGEGRTVLQYGTCSKSSAYLEAAQNYRTHAVMQGGPRVPSQSILYWGGLSYGHGIAATLPTWSNNSRALRRKFAKWVTDTEATCSLSNSYNSLCVMLPEDNPENPAQLDYNKYVVSPWVAGDWNPFIKCDTSMNAQLSATFASQEVLDTWCHPDICNPSNKTVGGYRTQAGTGFQKSQNAINELCSILDGKGADFPNIPHTVRQYDSLGNLIDTISKFETYDNNLCVAQPITLAACDHAQGMLSGRRGKTQRPDLSRKKALYETSPYTIPSAQRGRGLFLGGGNPLFGKGETRYENDDGTALSFMQTSQYEIGGTHIVLKISPGADGVASMYIDKTPLSCTGCADSPTKRVQNGLSSNATHGLTGWLRNLEPSLLAEQAYIDKLYPVPQPGNKWSCPLRRVAFYTRAVDDPDFSPLVPNPPRAARLFNQVGGRGESMNFNTRSHPAQLPATMQKLPDVHTPNGFCMCSYPEGRTPATTPCQFASNHPSCSYQQVLRSVYDQGWRESVIADMGGTLCKRQVDWPYENGTMRDSTQKAVADRGTCDLTPRLPKFRFRYASRGEIRRKGTTTLDPGGACHMGVPARWPEGQYDTVLESRLCTKSAETDRYLTVSCVIAGVESSYNFSKKEVEAPSWAVNAMREARTRCNECSPLPEWRYIYNYEEKELKHPEVSYGVPFRWSSARLLAASAKAAICGSRSNASEACLAMLNATNWRAGEFMRLFSQGGVEQLLNNPRTSYAQGLHEKLGAPMLFSEDAFWNESGWVACTQEADSKCYGTIPKAVWEGKGRLQACSDEYVRQVGEQPGVQDNAVGLDVCTLDEGLNALCRVLGEAKQKVADANCLLAGACARSMFVYSPGFYSVPNSEFSRATVADYYTYYAGTQDACPLEDEEIQLKARNTELHMQCASTQLEAVQIGLRVARQVVHVVVKVMYIQVQLVLSILKLVVATVAQSLDAVIREIEFWFQQLINAVYEAVEEIGNLLYKMIMNTGGFGQVLQEIIKVICAIMDFVVREVWNKITCPILKNIVAPLLQLVRDVINAVLTLIPWVDAGNFLSVFDNIIDFFQGLGCNDSISCADLEFGMAESPTGALPMTSRCFVDYTPSVDDANPYSCTRSDTCSVPVFSYGAQQTESDRLRVCDACPATDPDLLNRYGCDTYTQTCSCATPKMSRDFCTSNDQCQLPDTNCALVSDYSTGTSYGATPCNLCRSASPVCLKSSSGVGTCSCLLQQPLEMQACVSLGQAAFPESDRLCGMAPQDMASSRKYSIPWGELSVTPCAMLGSANAFCVSSESYGKIVVGYGAAPGRRLLSAQHQGVPKIDHQQWSHVSNPCRLLAESAAKSLPLSITEQDTLEWCYARRDLANHTIAKLNLTRFDGGDHFLLSVTDFIDVISRRGAIHQILFEAPLLDFCMRQSKTLRGVRKVAESIAVSVVLALQQRRPGALSNMTGSPALQHYAEAQLEAFNTMFVDRDAEGQARGNSTKPDAAEPDDAGEPVATEHNATTSRALLAVELDDPRLASLHEFLETLRNLPKTGLSAISGSFQFPPDLLSKEGETCSAAVSIMDAVVNSALVLKRFFETYTTDPALGAWEWNIPAFNTTGGSGSRIATGNLFYDIMVNDVTGPYLGITPQSIKNFLSFEDETPAEAFTIRNVITSAVACDYEELMLCQHPKRRLATAVAMAIALCVAGGYILQNAGLPFPLWPFIPLISLWLAYGSAPTCAPMLSTCVIPDLFDLVNTAVPAKFHWPSALQQYPGCLPTRGVPSPSTPPEGFAGVKVNSARCLKPCSAFAFDGYQSTIAWVACYIRPDSCVDWDIPILGGVKQYTAAFAPVIRGEYGQDVRDAYSYCFYTTVPSAAPYLIAATFALVVALSFARVPFKIFAATLQTLVHAVCYSHVQIAAEQ